ncbi:MAG: 3-phosphoshikimate 1-carboxyvinyltransferase [Candidatus Omnitrophica bacterium]|nr:3-phosphoshikimate 1-carboxyvinyltransferase [Candidatus Omnitrophota bacterium]
MKAVEIAIPPDKSISHRAVMLASISEGVTRIKNLLMAEDIKRTINVFRAMGVTIEPSSPLGCHPWGATPGVGRVDVVVQGVGMRGLKKPRKPLYLGNSGTTMRILPGILAGQDFEAVLIGDKSLSGRPMRRVTEPLINMGAKIEGRGRSRGRLSRSELYPPLTIRGNRCLKAINYKSRVPSAQVKSCILLAGLYANGVTSVNEPEKSRDHTERMLSTFGCRVKSGRRTVSIKGPVKLRSPGAIKIPGDISSAAFFIVAGCILPGIKIVLKNVGLNPTRTGVLDILKRMGADIGFSTRGVYPERSRVENAAYFEPYGDIVVKSSKLRGVTISHGEVVRAIDEIPIIMVAACFAKGKTIIKGIEELKVKETDRVYSMTTNLQKIGADVQAKKKIIIINGGRPLAGARVSSFGDHRTAMSMLVAGLGAKGKVIVTGLDCINKSFLNFPNLLNKLN